MGFVAALPCHSQERATGSANIQDAPTRWSSGRLDAIEAAPECRLAEARLRDEVLVGPSLVPLEDQAPLETGRHIEKPAGAAANHAFLERLVTGGAEDGLDVHALPRVARRGQDHLVLVAAARDAVDFLGQAGRRRLGLGRRQRFPGRRLSAIISRCPAVTAFNTTPNTTRPIAARATAPEIAACAASGRLPSRFAAQATR